MISRHSHSSVPPSHSSLIITTTSSTTTTTTTTAPRARPRHPVDIHRRQIRQQTTTPIASIMTMAGKRPHPEGQGPNGDVKRVKPSDAVEAAKARARAKAAEIAARFKKPEATPAPPPPAASLPSVADRLAAVRARVDAIKTGSGGGTGAANAKSPTPDSTGPRFATTLGNRRPETPKADAKPTFAASRQGQPDDELENPYFDPKTAAVVKRAPRVLAFNDHGKYLDQASKLRAQRRLEEIKKTLAIQARRAGLDENSERGFLVQPPPDIEWWDEGVLAEPNYRCIDDPTKLKIDTDDSIVTLYVQHPPLLKAPQDQRLVQVKPMFLTTKEMQKLRRMRRAADLKEHQAKIRLGLEPPPPPKVKRGNMMRVMGEQAIADPTAVEMLVESQIQQRHDDHLTANEKRQLTKEDRHAKLVANQEKDAQKGLYMCVFKIKTLAFGKHRFQIDNNAKEHALTGITLFNPELNLVVVEGGAYAINKYKKLMLHRIKWQENGPPTENQAEKQASDPQWLRPVTKEGDIKDHSHNRCTLIFEGEIKERSFRKWSARVCETAGEARETLGRAKLDSLWALAKSMD
ncbi:PRP3-domain-containing protein [Decorospora gaudefroyi]|uniref:PRP3-domain-containing protein n=1 Tax=Decorospora gaudefroyi TaxID=184978 RepID=A0A6A5KG65_9PLEO|nr:PRP3-domain-containing protein [Decorospora gaudefroyi]